MLAGCVHSTHPANITVNPREPIELSEIGESNSLKLLNYLNLSFINRYNDPLIKEPFMDCQDVLLMLDYNEWANAKVLAACHQIPVEELIAARQCSFGSLMGTLVHIYAAERAWRLRLQESISPKKLAGTSDFTSLSALETAWREETAQTRAFVASLDDSAMRRWSTYTTTTGWPQGSTLWKALMHVVLHGMQFRAEAGLVLASLNCSPGDLDLILYLRESDQR
jgi:uncharacterized damage-inducible protein DinB